MRILLHKSRAVAPESCIRTLVALYTCPTPSFYVLSASTSTAREQRPSAAISGARRQVAHGPVWAPRSRIKPSIRARCARSATRSARKAFGLHDLGSSNAHPWSTRQMAGAAESGSIGRIKFENEQLALPPDRSATGSECFSNTSRMPRIGTMLPSVPPRQGRLPSPRSLHRRPLNAMECCSTECTERLLSIQCASVPSATSYRFTCDMSASGRPSGSLKKAIHSSIPSGCR
jgi:hypothetical protein